MSVPEECYSRNASSTLIQIFPFLLPILSGYINNDMLLTYAYFLRLCQGYGFRVLVFNVAFNNFSYIVAVSVIGGGNRSTEAKTTDKLYHIMLNQVHLACAGFELTTLVVMYTDCIGSCNSNYHTIATTTVPTILLHFLSQLTYCINIRSVKSTCISCQTA